MPFLHKNWWWRANSPGNHMFKLQALANRLFIYQKCKPRSLYYCSRWKKSKQPKPYSTYRVSGFMLTTSLAGFLIAKEGGFLQLAYWVLHPSHLRSAYLLLGFCFLIMRLLTATSLCLIFFFQGGIKIKTKFCIWLSLLFVCHSISHALVLHCLATNCLQWAINSNQGSDSTCLAVVD